MLSARAMLANVGAAVGAALAAGHTIASDPRFSASAAVAILALLLPLVISPLLVTLSLVLLLAWSLAGPQRAIEAIVLAGYVKLLNPGLVVIDTAAGPLVWAVLLVAGLRVLPATRLDDARRLGYLWAFAVLAAVLAAFGSHLKVISLMKVATFAWVISTLFVAYRSLAPAQTRRLATWFATLAVLTVLFSAATLAVPAIAFLRNGTGLQGVFLHPQTLAILVAPPAVYCLTALVLRRGAAAHPLALGFAALAWVVLVLTEARTGMAAAVAGVAAGAGMHLLRKRGNRLFASRARVITAVTAATIVVLIGAAASDRLGSAAGAFLFKRSGQASLGEAFEQSRGAGVAQQWRDFLARPLVGHGFGVFPEAQRETEVIEFRGIPVSAPVEKGFLPTAALEETGIVGLLLLCLALLQLGRLTWQGGDPRWFAVLVACIATNVGEATLLSPGGPGLLLWCLIGLAVQMSQMPASSVVVARPASPARRAHPNVMQ